MLAYNSICRMTCPTARRLAAAPASNMLSAASSLPSSFASPMAASVNVRWWSGTPSWVKKGAARADAAEKRVLLQFAAQFAPHRSLTLSLLLAFQRCGWGVNTREMISDGLTVDFTMKDSYVAFELVPAENIVSPDHPLASPLPASPPVASLLTASNTLAAPFDTPFPSAPAPWENPVHGMVYDQATAARHALIRSKGWALIPIPAPLLAVALAKEGAAASTTTVSGFKGAVPACGTTTRKANYSIRDLLFSLTLPLAPFEPRPLALQAEAKSGSGAPASTEAAGGASNELKAAKGKGTSNREKRKASAVAMDKSSKLSGASTRAVGRKRGSASHDAVTASIAEEVDMGGEEADPKPVATTDKKARK
jgi:hypothetical protein